MRTKRSAVWSVLVLAAVVFPACDDGTGPVDQCDAQPLPLSAAVTGPTVSDVTLYVEESGISVSATLTHPQGDGPLDDVPQTVGVFPDRYCSGEPFEATDDVVGSGVEESFGVVVEAQSEAELVEEIAAAVRWPVEVTVSDVDGNVVTGRVEGRVRR